MRQKHAQPATALHLALHAPGIHPHYGRNPKRPKGTKLAQNPVVVVKKAGETVVSTHGKHEWCNQNETSQAHMTLQLQPFTAKLRERFPEAKGLRLRRATRRGQRVFQLVGELADRTKIAREISGAKDEFSALEGALEMIPVLLGHDLAAPTRTLPLGQMKEIERKALGAINGEGRLATEQHKATHIKRLMSWLAEREQPINERSLLAYIKSTDQESRVRRSAIAAAMTVARAASKELDVPKELKYKPPRYGLVEEVSDDILVALYEEIREKIHPEDAWLLGIILLTGVRANAALSMEIDGIKDVGDQIIYWDSKRGRQAHTMPTIRGKWEEWDLSHRPEEWSEFLMPSDRPATDEQLQRANNAINMGFKNIQRKIGPERAKILSARSLRSATVARLLTKGLDPLTVADLVSTSADQIEKRYARFFRASAIKRAAAIL